MTYFYKQRLLIWMLVIITMMLPGVQINAQGFFNSSNPQAVRAALQDEKAILLPESHHTFEVDLNSIMVNFETQAPREFTSKNGFEFELPYPDGTLHKFEFWYSPSYEDGYQAKHPEIRSYIGRSSENPSVMARMTLSPLGMKAAIKTSKGMYYIDPLVEAKSRIHASMDVTSYSKEQLIDVQPFECGADALDHSPLHGMNLNNISGGNKLRGAGESVGIRTFRTAIAATGEWTSSNGGVAQAAAKIVASVDRANLLFESEVAIRLLLVANNDTIVFPDPNTDPYPGQGRKVGAELINVNTTHVDRYIGSANYDVGHVYTLACQMVGGIARRESVCDDNNKAAGTTCWSNPSIETTVIRVFCHEMGHQFSANHTFNQCDRENENIPTGYEPGSGSTIMSYAGGCGAQNVQGSEDPYYHCNTLQAMFGFSRLITCGSEIATGNTRPDVSFNHPDGLTIPISTPFYLRGTGSDMEGDDLSYCIEQHDAGIKLCDLGNPEGSCPAFRSIPPTDKDYRVFPRFTSIWNDQTSKNEVLVDYSREFNFVITARDNNAEVGGFGMDTVTFETSNQAGPFVVTYPNNGEALTAGSYVEITWDVANTNAAPVNCKEVDILMHRDSDFEDFTTIKSNTANDGSEWVLLPNQMAENVRITVLASENIFFDISDLGSDIEMATDPGYSLGLSPNSAMICLPAEFTTQIDAASLAGFQGTVDLDVVDGLPNGATYNFSSTSIDADGSSTLDIDLNNVTESGAYTIVVRAIGSNDDTVFRSIELEIVTSDFSDLAVLTPADGSQGVSQNTGLTWMEVDDADSYDVQLATSPSFDAGSIIEEFLGVTGNSVTLNQPLEKNTVYFWRVRAINVCGPGSPIIPAAFSTESAVCADLEAPDKDLALRRGQTTTSELNINNNADIIDLNVSNVDMYSDFLSDAIVELEGPDGTKVILARNECVNTTDMNCGFDDDATRGIKCPPNTGELYQPRGSLSDFVGKNANGLWKLNITIESSAGSSGDLYGWTLEICTNSSAEGPVLVVNDTLKTKPGENNAIRGGLLRAEDVNNGADELTYVLSTIPNEGELQMDGSALNVGMSFTQQDINSGRISYDHLGADNTVDGFVFTVNDGEGGFTGSHVFDIDVNESNPSSTTLTYERVFTIYPNPATSSTLVVFDGSLTKEMTVELTDLNGKLISSRIAGIGATNTEIDLSGLSKGIYIVKANDDHRYYSVKLTVQ